MPGVLDVLPELANQFRQVIKDSEKRTEFEDERFRQAKEYQARLPFIVTCRGWLEPSRLNRKEEPRFIVFSVNPRSVSWNLPQRAVEGKMRGGNVLYVWKDKQRSQAGFRFYDQPQATFTFQSGNTMPVRYRGGEPVISSGQHAFYEFLELVDEEKVLKDGVPNEVLIVYNSRTFPRLTLSGIFVPNTIAFDDTSEDPNQVTWTATFSVWGSNPALGNSAQLRTKWDELAREVPSASQRVETARSAIAAAASEEF